MKILNEARLNTHQLHLEQLVLLGDKGFNELNDKIDKFLRRFEGAQGELNLTQKIDGSPALFIWHKYPGYPDNSIALKGFTSGPQNALSSEEQIDSKYGDRPDMAAKLKLGLQLARYIPSGEAWQGDCLFSKDDIREEEIEGKKYLTFMPNKIVYAFSEDNADYNKVKNSDFGIAFHTIYKNSDGTMKQWFNVDPTRLKTPDNFYIMSPAINASSDKVDYNLDNLESEYSKLKSLEQKLLSDNAYNDLINNSQFMNYWNTFENANLADKKQVNLNVNTVVNDLKEYVKDKQEKEYNNKVNKLKTDKGRQGALDKYTREVQELANIIENNKSTIVDLVNALNTAANIKMLMWEGLRKSKNDYSTFYKSRTKGYIPSEGEGIAMSTNDGNIVKIVDRSLFSSYNRDPDIMSGFEHEGLEMAATQRGDMGSFGKFTKKITLDEDGSNKTAVIGAGRLNPPTIGHEKLIDTMALYSQGEKPKLFLTHSQDNKKNPLSYHSKLNWVRRAFGDKVDVPETDAKTILQYLQELYEEGYTNIVYVGGGDRIGGVEDVTQTILKYNGQPDRQGNIIYNFDSIEFKNAGERSGDDLASNASASLARKYVLENDFDHFKEIVPFNEKDAYNLFKELKYAMKGKEESFLEACEKRIEQLSEATRLTKNKYTPEIRNALDKELDKIDKKLDAPDPNMDAASYRQHIDQYTGLFTKQGSTQNVVYSEKDIKKLYPNYEEILRELDNLVIKDTQGKEYELDSTGTQVITKSGGGLDPTTTTLLQESISGLILGNRIKEQDVKEYLSKSDPIKKNGIFEELNFNKNITIEDWNDFIKKWGNSFNVEQNERSKFINVANSILDGNIEEADIIHDALKNKYSGIARDLLTGADQFDKSDVYFCVGDTSKILSTMLNFRKNNDIIGYVNFMVENSDKIIGVSLKQVGKEMKVVWDIPPKKSSDFSDDVFWPKSQADSQALLFKDADNKETYILSIRPNSKKAGSPGAIEWREDGGKAMMGKGASKIEKNFGEEFAEKLITLRREHKFAEATKLFLTEITGTDVTPGNGYRMSKKGKQKLVSFFNDSCGFNSMNDEGQRVSAPYIKVY